MSVEVFGKSIHDILSSKRSFFVNNREKLDKAHRDAAVYVAQPRRLFCKICSHRLPSTAAFIKHGIGYSYCEDCGHLNGVHEDTDAFCEYLYVRGGRGVRTELCAGQSRVSSGASRENLSAEG